MKIGKTFLGISPFFFLVYVRVRFLFPSFLSKFYDVNIHSFNAADKSSYPGLSLPSSSGFVLGALLHQASSLHDVAHYIRTRAVMELSNKASDQTSTKN